MKKGSIFLIYKECFQINKEITKNATKKLTNASVKEDIQMVSKHIHTKHLTSILIKNGNGNNKY